MLVLTFFNVLVFVLIFMRHRKRVIPDGRRIREELGEVEGSEPVYYVSKKSLIINRI